MGVLNVSPDSFSGDGLADVDGAVARAERLASEGADIIDVGGESTRPDSAPISID
ncbi:MAG: dihydropteroate synthase, partial [Dehalococcoidia bacterium]